MQLLFLYPFAELLGHASQVFEADEAIVVGIEQIKGAEDLFVRVTVCDEGGGYGLKGL